MRYSKPQSFSEESNAPRVRSLVPTQAGREAAGWWPTSPSSRWAGRRITPASWLPTTSRICPATASPRAGGTAPAPNRSACRAKHRRRGSRLCSRAGNPRLASCWAAPTAATPCPPLRWSCGRPRACRSCTAWVTRPSDGRCWRPIMPGWSRRWPTWTSTWGPAGVTVVSSMCPDRGCWRSGSTTGRPEKATPCSIRTWSSPTASKDQMDVGQRWTDGTCTGIGWPRTPSTGPATNASCPERSEWSGRGPTATATASSRGCPRTWCVPFPSAPAISMPNSSG
jgi:hypothetical protein